MLQKKVNCYFNTLLVCKIVILQLVHMNAHFREEGEIGARGEISPFPPCMTPWRAYKKREGMQLTINPKCEQKLKPQIGYTDVLYN